jgi:hypothetical protein
VVSVQVPPRTLTLVNIAHSQHGFCLLTRLLTRSALRATALRLYLTCARGPRASGLLLYMLQGVRIV